MNVMEASDFMKTGKSKRHAMAIISQAGEGGDSMFDNTVKIQVIHLASQ